MEWLEQVRGAKPATIRDYAALLREPGIPYKRGTGVSQGQIMAAFGALDAERLTPRNVNKHGQVLQAMFAYGCRSDTFELPLNPVVLTDKRREPPLAALDWKGRGSPS